MATSAIAQNDSFVEEAPTTRSGMAFRAQRVVLSSEITTSSESQFFADLTGDVSEGGVFIATYRRVAIGSRVVVSLSLPAGDVELPGIVQWIRDACGEASPGLGVAFEHVSVEARAGIDEFCRLRAPLYHESVADPPRRATAAPARSPSAPTTWKKA